MELGENDPVWVETWTAMWFLKEILLPVSEQQKKELAVGFNAGFDKDDLVHFIKARIKK